MRKIGRAVAIVALLPVLCGLLGCSKAPEYTAQDIRSVSLSCGHMDYSHSYSFYLRKSDGGWLLDAEYAVDSQQPRTEYEACPVSEEDARALLHIVQEQDVIDQLRRYRKKASRVQVMDETTYCTAVLLSDGEQLMAPKRISQDLETGFRRLAEKYAPAEPGADPAG